MADRDRQSAHQGEDQQTVEQADPGAARCVEITDGIHGYDRVQNFLVCFEALFAPIWHADGHRDVFETVGAALVAVFARPDGFAAWRQAVRVHAGGHFHATAQGNVDRPALAAALPHQFPEFDRVQPVAGGVDFFQASLVCSVSILLCNGNLLQVVVKLQVDPAKI